MVKSFIVKLKLLKTDKDGEGVQPFSYLVMP